MAAAVEPGQRSRWLIVPRQLERENSLSEETGVPPIVAAVLLNRGIETPEQASRYLKPSLEDLHDPRLLPDFDEAMGEIIGARERGEKIFVHGDYDADGITSTTILTRALQTLKCDVTPHVPHRVDEGYGIHIATVKRAAKEGAKLFLTCDCGTSAQEQIDAAIELGMRVVVTDHHEPSGDRPLPKAHAVVNPKRRDSKYPFDGLAGAGVAYKLCMGLCTALGHPDRQFKLKFSDLAAIGTTVDVMRLVDENRSIVAAGLKQLAITKREGLKALIETSGLKPPPFGFSTYNLGFQIGPRINAVGRIEGAESALRLLLSDDKDEARALAERLESANTERRAIQTEEVAFATEKVERDGHLDHKFIVLRHDVHEGIIGLIAGQLKERYCRPALVLASTGDGRLKGSGRSIDAFNLHDCIEAHRHLLTSGGGHAMAAGIGLEEAAYEEFAQSVRQYAAERLTNEDLVPTFRVDVEARLDEVPPQVIESFSLLEPCGQGNRQALIAIRNLRLTRVLPTRTGEHARFSVADERGNSGSGMAFGMGPELAAWSPDQSIDIIVEPDRSFFNGSVEYRWTLRDFAPSGSE